MSRRVLVVDDDPNLRQMLVRYLRAEGFEVTEASNGEEALGQFRRSTPDLVVLDVAMPGQDGFEVLQRLRADSDAFVIMLTARAEEVDRIVGLTMGADDYVTKPFSPRELVARIRVILRRGRDSAVTDSATISLGGLVIDNDGRRVEVDGEELGLSALEFDLLMALAASPGRVFTRTRLLEQVWGWDYFGSDRVVDVHIANVRKKLGDSANEPRFIETVRGVGYRLRAGGS